jgi:hypothetical protein
MVRLGWLKGEMRCQIGSPEEDKEIEILSPPRLQTAGRPADRVDGGARIKFSAAPPEVKMSSSHLTLSFLLSPELICDRREEVEGPSRYFRWVYR